MSYRKWESLSFDALHLTLAEYAGVDMFLTTDVVLLRKISKADIRVSCSNPLTFIVGEITS